MSIRARSFLLLTLACMLVGISSAKASEFQAGSGIRFTPRAAGTSAAGLTSSALNAHGQDDGEHRLDQADPDRAELDEENAEELLSASEYLVKHALGYLGVRYRFGGTSPKTGLDCSGLVLNVFRDALDVELPRTAGEMSRLGEKIARHDLKPGDLVFFNTMRRAFSHVGIYLGEGKFVHAPSSGGKVRIERLATAYWAKRFNGGRRLIDQQEEYPDLVQNLTLLR